MFYIISPLFIFRLLHFRKVFHIERTVFPQLLRLGGQRVRGANGRERRLCCSS